MSDIHILMTLCLISTMTCMFCILGMLTIYKSMEKSLIILTDALYDMSKCRPLN